MRVECLVDDRDFDCLIDDPPEFSSPNVDRKGKTALEGPYSSGPIPAGGRLHHRNRPDVFARRPRLMNKEVGMRLKEAAGTELDNPPRHPISTNAFMSPFFSVVQRGRSAMAPMKLVR